MFLNTKIKIQNVYGESTLFEEIRGPETGDPQEKLNDNKDIVISDARAWLSDVTHRFLNFV